MKTNKLSKDQLQYLQKRVNDIFNKKVDKVKQGYRALLDAEFTEYMASGKATFKAGIKFDDYGTLYNQFNFNGKKYEAVMIKETEVVNVGRKATLDKIILSDADEALKTLQEIEKD